GCEAGVVEQGPSSESNGIHHHELWTSCGLHPIPESGAVVEPIRVTDPQACGESATPIVRHPEQERRSVPEKIRTMVIDLREADRGDENTQHSSDTGETNHREAPRFVMVGRQR